MPSLDHNKVKTLVVTAAKAVADATYPVVAFGDPEPNSGEQAGPIASTTFARVDSIDMKLMPRRGSGDTHAGTVSVTVLVFWNALGDAMDIEADLRAMVGALDQKTLRDTSGGVTTELDLQLTQIKELTPPSEARCDRLVGLVFEGPVKAE